MNICIRGELPSPALGVLKFALFTQRIGLPFWFWQFITTPSWSPSVASARTGSPPDPAEAEVVDLEVARSLVEAESVQPVVQAVRVVEELGDDGVDIDVAPGSGGGGAVRPVQRPVIRERVVEVLEAGIR